MSDERTPMERRPARWWPAFRVVALLIVFVSCGFASFALFHFLADFSGISYRTPSRPFAREFWNDPEWERSAYGEIGGESLRLLMVDDLIENQLVWGMSKSEVRALLGSPDVDPSSWRYEWAEWWYRLYDAPRTEDDVRLLVYFDGNQLMFAKAYSDWAD